MKRMPHDQSGYSLVSVMVAAGLLGIVVTIVVTLLGTNTKMMAAVRARHDLEDTRRWLGISTNCDATIAAMGSCPGPGNEIAVRSNTADLISRGPAYRRMGTYELRATCEGNNPTTIEVQYRKTDGVWQSLYGRLPMKC